MRLAGRGLLGEVDLNFSVWVILFKDSILVCGPKEPVHLGTQVFPRRDWQVSVTFSG